MLTGVNAMTSRRPGALGALWQAGGWAGGVGMRGVTGTGTGMGAAECGHCV